MGKAAKNIYASLRRKHLLRVFIAVLNLVLFAFPVHSKEPVRIGVLANLGKETAVRMWTPTADYLTTRIPQHLFTIIPLSFDEINRSVERKEVDFVLTNPGIYVELEYTHGVTRIATLDGLWNGKEHNSFGGVIFTRADRGDINELRDLKDKSFIAVHETSYGGWSAAFRELKAGSIDPWRHFSRLLFSGESQEEAVFAVRDGKADAGTVRTGILERMAEKGTISLEAFKILNPQKVEGFPLLLSTRLYPEWAFGRLRHTRDVIAKKVAAALLDMPADSPAAKAGKIAGFTVPLDYQPVHELMKELRLGLYKDYGKLTLGQGLKRYWPGILMLFAITFFLGYVTLYLLKLKKEIAERKKAEEALKEREEKFRQIAENIREFFWVTDPEKNQMIYISPAYEAIWGRTCESLYAEPKNWLEAIHPEDRERVLGAAVTKQTTGEYDEQYRIVTPEGAIRWIRDRAFPVKDESGKVCRVTGVAEDITARKKAEEESKTANEELLAINRVIMACSTILDSKEILNTVMDEALRITGLEGGTICLVTPDETLHLAAHRATSEATIRDLEENVVKVGDCLCGECARNQKPLILPDREAVLKFSTREATRGEDIRFHAAFPLIVKETCLGVLCIFTRTDKKPSGRGLKLIETVTLQIALAIENAQLYEETVRHAATLEDKVNERTAELEIKIAEIERMNKLFVGRELRMMELKEKIKELEEKTGQGEKPQPAARDNNKTQKHGRVIGVKT